MTDQPKSDESKRPDRVCKIGSIGIDWLQVSTYSGTPEADVLGTIAQMAHTDALAAGDTLQDWKFQQFEGQRAGSVFYGHFRGQDALEVTGAAADIIARYMRVHCPKVTVGRIDTQITAHIAKSGAEFVREEFKRHEARGHRNRQNRRISGDLKWQAKKGETFYLGTRKSDLISRIYYKSLEQKGEIGPDWQRFENERHKKYARLVWRDYCATHSPDDFIKGVVMQTFENQGLPVEFLGDAMAVDLTLKRPVNDIEKFTSWLFTSIKPAILKRAHQGHKEIMQAFLQDCLDALETPDTLPNCGYPDIEQ